MRSVSMRTRSISWRMRSVSRMRRPSKLKSQSGETITARGARGEVGVGAVAGAGDAGGVRGAGGDVVACAFTTAADNARITRDGKTFMAELLTQQNSCWPPRYADAASR